MADYIIDNMTPEDAEQSMQWMDARVRAECGTASGVDEVQGSAPARNYVFPRMWIPETGLIVRVEYNNLLAVAFVYFEKTAPIAYCGWLVANPGNTARESYRAIRLLANAIPNYAQQNGAKCLLTCYGNRGINRILDQAGFQNGEDCETKFKLLQ